MAGISFSGIASGIDGDAIIKNLIETRKLASVPLENKVAFDKNENTAFEEFNTKLLTLNDTLKDFLTLAGGAVSKTASSSNEEALTATAGTSAVASTTTFTVNRLASTASISFADTFTSVTTPIAPGLSGSSTVQITVGTGANAETFAVPVDAETTVDSLVTAINNASASGKVQATVVNAGTESEPQYKVVVMSTRTGTDFGTLDIVVAPEILGQGVLQIGNIQQAVNSEIALPSIGLSRDRVIRSRTLCLG
jgi:flagellar hook-associated protein 2